MSTAALTSLTPRSRPRCASSSSRWLAQQLALARAEPGRECAAQRHRAIVVAMPHARRSMGGQPPANSVSRSGGRRSGQIEAPTGNGLATRLAITSRGREKTPRS
eukprot:3646365-Pyramimonas_sp.AAC.1